MGIIKKLFGRRESVKQIEATDHYEKVLIKGIGKDPIKAALIGAAVYE